MLIFKLLLITPIELIAAASLLQLQVMEKPQILVYVERSLNYSAFDVKWVPKSAKVVALGSHPRGTGALQVVTRDSC